MPNLTPTQYADYLAKQGATDPLKGREIKAKVERELELHYQIIRYCNAQWPQWPYIHSRTDKPSTIAEGCQDFTIFKPGGPLCIECKRPGEKPDLEQIIWHKQMEMLGYRVHVIDHYDEFLALVKPKPTPFEAPKT